MSGFPRNQLTENVPTAIYAAAYGVVGGSAAAAAANRATMNNLLRLAELQNTDVIAPAGASNFIFLDQPLVHRSGAKVKGVGGTNNLQSVFIVAAGGNCPAIQYQRAMFQNGSDGLAISTFPNDGSVVYQDTDYTKSTGYTIFGGTYYLYIGTGTYTPNGAATPPNDPTHWMALSPTNQTTFTGVFALSSTAAVSVTVADGTQFGIYGGKMQTVIGGTTYQFTYAGVVANTVLGVQLVSGSVTTANGSPIYPFDAANTASENVTYHGGWPSTMSPGRFDPVSVYSSGVGGDVNWNVTCMAGTGDGIWSPITNGGLPGGNIGPANGPGAYSGQRVFVGSSSLFNSGTGYIASADSHAVAHVCGAGGLGGHLIASASTRIDGKSWNNGRQPIFKSARTIVSGNATITLGTTITVTGANFGADDIGQGIWDGSAPGTGGLIPAGTFIIGVVSATVATLSQTATNGTTTTTLNIAGYYFWPTATGSNNVITGCVSTATGAFYVLKVASITGATDPSGDATHFTRLRTVVEWGWDVTETASAAENTIKVDSQISKFGAYNAIGSSASTVTITASGWITNPWSFGQSFLTAPTVPSGLQASGCINLGSSIGHNVRLAARQPTAPTFAGVLIQPGTATNCDVRATTDSHPGTILNGPITASTTLTVNGVVYGPTGPAWQLTSGSWYPEMSSGTNVIPTANVIHAVPFTVVNPRAFQFIGEIVNLGQVGGSLRFGIYADNGGTPVGGALIWESGSEQPATAAATVAQSLGTNGGGTLSAGYGPQTATTLTLGPGQYWLAVAVHASGTVPTVRTTQPGTLMLGQSPMPGASSPNGGNTFYGFASTASTFNGALPNPFPAGSAAPNATYANLLTPGIQAS